MGNVWCWRHHVCMAGHMEHPPYPLWHYLADTGWALAWDITALVLVRDGNPFGYVGAAGLALLTAWRLRQ